MGFLRKLAQPLVRFGELPVPLSDGIRGNAALLAKYVEPSSIGGAQSAQLATFLRCDPALNRNEGK